MTFINSMLIGLVSLVGTLLAALARPLWNLAGQNFPDFSNLMIHVVNLLQVIVGGVGWVINALGLEPVIHMVILYWIAYVLLSVGSWGIKIILRWYRIIMP